MANAEAESQGRNPFVNQVSFFREMGTEYSSLEGIPRSQSLRKSGQFLSNLSRANLSGADRRNPFVNQVSFFTHVRPRSACTRTCRNPFVNQVSFFVHRQSTKQGHGASVAIPS